MKVKKNGRILGKDFEDKCYTCGNYEIVKRTLDGLEDHFYFIIRAREGASRFLPEIYHNFPSIFRNPDTESVRFKKGYFYIQTTAYGGLELDEYGKFVKAVIHAQKVVEALNEYFLKPEEKKGEN